MNHDRTSLYLKYLIDEISKTRNIFLYLEPSGGEKGTKVLKN